MLHKNPREKPETLEYSMKSLYWFEIFSELLALIRKSFLPFLFK
jgi:hypothetical protein